MHGLSTRGAARHRFPKPTTADAFYGAVLRLAEDASTRHARVRQDKSDQARTQPLAFKTAELWWDHVFTPEFAKAQHALQARSIVLYEVKAAAKDNINRGSIARVVVLRANHRSHAYRFTVEDNTISFRKLDGVKAVAIEGFYTSVDVAKSSPDHVRLMLTTMIKESLTSRIADQ